MELYLMFNIEIMARIRFEGIFDKMLNKRTSYYGLGTSLEKYCYELPLPKLGVKLGELIK